jgi:hypothetical protein
LKNISQERRLARFASKHTKEEFRLLVVFKTIKTRVEQELAKRKIKFDEDVLNEVCIEKANELLPIERDIGSDELAGLIEKIAFKTKEKYAKQHERDR